MTPDEERKVRAAFPGLSKACIARTFGASSISKAEHEEAMASNRKLEILPTTDEARLNKTEKAYLEFLRKMRPQWIGVQCITLKLGHDCRYTPDFWAMDVDGLRAIDVKGGHTWEDSLIKLRVAARLFPFIYFIIAKRKGLVWEHTPFKP
jgi:hypothetical protein